MITKEMIESLENINTGKIKILFKFPVAHLGWEFDSEGAVVCDEHGRRSCVMTSHGAPFYASTRRMKHQIVKYETWIRKTKQAILKQKAP